MTLPQRSLHHLLLNGQVLVAFIPQGAFCLPVPRGPFFSYMEYDAQRVYKYFSGATRH